MYESENRPGCQAADGGPVPVLSYTIRLGDGRRVVVPVGVLDELMTRRDVSAEAVLHAAEQHPDNT